MSGPLTPRRARWLTLRAHAALAMWVLVAGGLALIGVVIVLTGLTQDAPDARVRVAAGPAAVWLGGYVLACAICVWTYRRHIGPWTASPDPALRMRAETLTQVRLAIAPIADLVGVDTGPHDETALARWIGSRWPLVGHAAAIGALVVAAAWS